MWFSSWIRVMIVASSIIQRTESSKGERDLFKDLFENYCKLTRPVRNPQSPLTVYIKVFLQQIITLDMKNQVMELNAWIRYIWNDYRLSWDPEAYENVTSIRVTGGEESNIWIPDILLYNSCDEEHFDSRFVVNAVVYSDGLVNWIPPGVFKITCKVDITWFPFDEQSCYMQSPFSESDIYPTIRFWMHLRRRTLYYMFNMIIPSALISLMTLLSFILPAHDMSEKIGHQTTILLTVCFFLTEMSNVLPPTSESVSLLAVFFSIVTCIVSASTAFTITVLNMRYRHPFNHKTSRTFRKIFCELLPWLMMVKRPGYRFSRGSSRKASKKDVVCTRCAEDSENSQGVHLNGFLGNGGGLYSSLTKIPTQQLCLERKVGEGIFARESSFKKSRRQTQREKFVDRVYQQAKHKTKKDKSFPEDEETMLAFSILEGYMAMSIKLSFMCQIIKEKRKRVLKQEEWKFAAMAFDRFLLFLFSFFMTVTILTLSYSAPYFNA